MQDVKVCGPYVVTSLNQMPVLSGIWQVLVVKNGHHKDVHKDLL